MHQSGIADGELDEVVEARPAADAPHAPPPPALPVSAAERIESIDVLRGFAVLAS